MNTDHRRVGVSPLFTRAWLSLLVLGCLTGCDHAKEELVLYTSVDQPIAKAVLDEFTRQSGIGVTIVTDTEATRSVGLAERLRAEKNRPRADVWWGNEPFHTINLAEEGLFAAYASPSADDVPELFKDAQHRWTGNGLRARVFITRGFDGSIPTSIESMDGRGMAMARPAVGTTAGHVSAIYLALGQEQGDALYRRLRTGGVKLLGGNGPVADAVARGELLYGLTDNDDVENVRRINPSVEAIPARLNGEAFMIPTTVALVAGRPESDPARKLVDFLLSADAERKLIEAKFAGWSIRGGADHPPAMRVDYREVARGMPEAVRRATAILDGREP